MAGSRQRRNVPHEFLMSQAVFRRATRDSAAEWRENARAIADFSDTFSPNFGNSTSPCATAPKSSRRRLLPDSQRAVGSACARSAVRPQAG